MIYHKTIVCILVLCLKITPGFGSETHLLNPPANLRCEYRTNPLGIDAKNPRLSWEVRSGHRGAKQSSYQILVASSYEKLGLKQADIWKSGKVASSQSIQIEYQGKPLESGQRYYWKVRTWDQSDHPSEFSEAAWWEMGLLEKKDWQGRLKE